MKTRIAVLALLTFALVQIGAADKTRVSRASIASMETSIDKQLTKLWPDDPFLLLGTTRGVYLDGYGAVFTAELNLVTAPGISPFHPTMSKEDIARYQQKKLERLAQLREQMRGVLVSTASSMDNVPAEEQIVVAASLFRYPWEDAARLPAQILMQGRRGQLRTEAAIQVREF